MHISRNTHIVHYSNDLLDIACRDILKQQQHLLPDLRTVTIFLSNNLAQKPLLDKLTKYAFKQGYPALLSPNCTTLRKWALSMQAPNKPLLSQYARELILVDAINQQSSLFANTNPWIIANELLSFFDDMTLNNIDPLKFQNHFNQNKLNEHTSYALSQDATLVTTLWQAWQQQLSQESMLDPVETYIHALQQSEFSKHEIFYSIGLDKLSECELSVFRKIEDQSQLHLFIYASNAQLSSRPDFAIKDCIDPNTNKNHYSTKEISPYSKLLDSIYIDNGLSIKQRAENFSNAYPISPANTRLKVYKTNSFEQHVKALDIKIRNCLHADIDNIGVVTADRKLVRRLRAVLEHANVQVNDLGGWALATTSAAVVIELWLQLVEERFPAKHLLALARSPFFPTSIDEELHDKAINLFEKDIVLPLNLHNGLSLFRDALEKYQIIHDTIDEQTANYILELLDKFETATQSLTRLLKQKSSPLHRFFEELLNSLKTFGFFTMLRKDEAGKQVIELFELQISHFKNIENAVDWSEYRRFIARLLDQQNFKHTSVKSNVTFCSLEQSRLLNFDSLIIASVDKDHFPGASINYIFFNEHIRSELSIPTWRNEHALHFYLFRMLLDAAPDILITVQNEKNGEAIMSSPWLEAIETFHSMAYGNDLIDKSLQALVGQSGTSIEQQLQHIPIPDLSKQPTPLLTENLKPNSISISQYQRLMNCPYQFYATTCLKLSKTDELYDELNKADFGSLVHHCLYAFFTNEPSMPGPFAEKVTEKNREAAERMLISISHHVFKHVIEHRFSDQLWLQRWLNLIPKFIDWEIQRQVTHTPHKHEAPFERNINATITLNGRIDRIDRIDGPASAYAIIDYKTGQTPSQKSVVAGEQVQLPMYAFLYENCNQVEYVNIGKDNNVKTESTLKDSQLDDLISEHRSRLVEFANALNNDIPFTALADDDTCEWCEVRGLCRKDYWQS